MKQISFPMMYLYWHYSQSVFSFFSLVKNILWFLFNFFSIGLLLRTLPSPWRRLSEDAYGGKDRNIGTDFLVQFLMRLVGFVLRIITISIGLTSIILFLVISILSFIVWIFLPFMLLIFIAYGFIELFIFIK